MIFWAAIGSLVVGVVFAGVRCYGVWQCARDPFGGGGAPTLDVPIVYPVPMAVGLSLVLIEVDSYPFWGFGLVAWIGFAVFFGFLIWLFMRIGAPERERQLQLLLRNLPATSQGAGAAGEDSKRA